MTESHSQVGFSLIETVLYIGLFVIVLGSVIIATYNMIESTDKSQYKSLMQNDAQFSIRKMHWLLNGATNVSTSSASTLQITNPTLSSNPILLQMDGSKLAMQLDSNTYALTGDIAPVSELAFVVTGVNRPAEVQMSFRMNNKYYDETFTAKKLLR